MACQYFVYLAWDHEIEIINIGNFLFYRYNFYTFGHAVRELYSSRGSREGNNAFLEVRISALAIVLTAVQIGGNYV